MHNRYTMITHGNFLHVQLQTNFHFTPASATDLHRDAAGTARRQKLTRVLIEGDSPVCKLCTIDVFDLGKLVAEQLRRAATAYCLRGYTPGFVEDEYGKPVNKIEFFGKVVQNRGGVVNFFDSQGDARQWLGLQQHYPLAS